MSQLVIYKTLLSDLRRVNGWRLPALISMMSIVAFTDGLAMMLLLPLLSRVGIVSSDSTAAVLVNKLLSFLTPDGSGIGAILVVILLLSSVQMLLNVTQGWFGARLIHRYAFHWQSRIYRAIIRADWRFLTERKGGELSNAIVVEAPRAGGAFYYFTLVASTTVACGIYFMLALLVTWRATLLLLVLMALMAFAIRRFYRVSHAAGDQTSTLNAEMQVLVTETLSSLKIIKATTSEQQMGERVEKISRSLERVGGTRLFVPNVVRAIFEFMAFSSLAIFFAFGMVPLQVAPGDIMVVLALFVRLLPKVTNAQTLLHELNSQAPALAVLQRIFAEAQDAVERRGGDETFTVTPPARLEVNGLSAGYGDKLVLDDLSLALDVPGMVGIVGGSGAGKSTLVHVLLGLVNPTGGSVTLGGRNMCDASLDAWRRLIGYVPQETMFFHASVAENLALARPGATREEIIDAARRAHAHDFIMALPQGYDTSIGDQGVLLSGGQRQRLGIARALLANPVLLLLDEPTSALDPNAEKEIMATLDNLRRSVGIVIVAHRLTTVQQSDRIYVLDKGRVAESGTWADLIAREDLFHSLAKLQQIVA